MVQTSLLLKDQLRQREENAPTSSRHALRHCDKNIVVQNGIAVSPIFCSQLCLINSHIFWGKSPVRDDFYEDLDITV